MHVSGLGDEASYRSKLQYNNNAAWILPFSTAIIIATTTVTGTSWPSKWLDSDVHHTTLSTIVGIYTNQSINTPTVLRFHPLGYCIHALLFQIQVLY